MDKETFLKHVDENNLIVTLPNGEKLVVQLTDEGVVADLYDTAFEEVEATSWATYADMMWEDEPLILH